MGDSDLEAIVTRNDHSKGAVARVILLHTPPISRFCFCITSDDFRHVSSTNGKIDGHIVAIVSPFFTIVIHVSFHGALLRDGDQTLDNTI